METCGDNRFEIIERAKKAILERTNIDSSADEMKVLNNFLFRCWQMGWLDKYDDGAKTDEPVFDNEKACQVSLLNVQSSLLHQIVRVHEEIQRKTQFSPDYDGSYDRGYAKGLLNAYETIGSF